MKITKKNVNLLILVFACVILLWGIIASCITFANNNNNTKITASPWSANNLDKDGKIMQTTDVDAKDADLYVKNTDVEVISQKEYQTRNVKNLKILMERAEKDLKDSKIVQRQYDEAAAAYNVAKKNLSRTTNAAFTAGSATFFGTYFPIIVLLGIALAVNQKVDYPEKEAKADNKAEKTKENK